MELEREETYREHTIKILYDDGFDCEWEEFTNHERQDKEEDFYFLVWHSRMHDAEKSWGSPENALSWAKEHKYWVFPLFLYEHGGRAWSLGSFSCLWDSGQAGYVLLSKKSFRLAKSAKKSAQSHVEYINAIERGQVFGYQIEDQAGEDIDSCWGFVGDADYCFLEAKAVLDHHLDQDKTMLPA